MKLLKLVSLCGANLFENYYKWFMMDVVNISFKEWLQLLLFNTLYVVYFSSFSSIISGILKQKPSPKPSSLNALLIHPSNIQMNPFSTFFHKILQKRSSLRCPTLSFPWRAIRNIGLLVFDEISVVIIYGHVPGLFMDLFSGVDQAVFEVIVVCEETCITLAQCRWYSSCKSR